MSNFQNIRQQYYEQIEKSATREKTRIEYVINLAQKNLKILIPFLPQNTKTLEEKAFDLMFRTFNHLPHHYPSGSLKFKPQPELALGWLRKKQGEYALTQKGFDVLDGLRELNGEPGSFKEYAEAWEAEYARQNKRILEDLSKNSRKKTT